MVQTVWMFAEFTVCTIRSRKFCIYSTYVPACTVYVMFVYMLVRMFHGNPLATGFKQIYLPAGTRANQKGVLTTLYATLHDVYITLSRHMYVSVYVHTYMV